MRRTTFGKPISIGYLLFNQELITLVFIGLSV
jgi:hypothetical protein